VIDYRGEEVKKSVALQVNRALHWLGDYGVNIAKTHCPVDQGKLRSGITKEVDAPRGNLKVGSPSEVAPHVEFGTGPHKTSLKSIDFVENITAWCHRQGITNKNIIYLIIRHIRRYGTTASPFLRPSFDEVSLHAESVMNDFLVKAAE
jgi:hypothetical protein